MRSAALALVVGIAVCCGLETPAWSQEQPPSDPAPNENTAPNENIPGITRHARVGIGHTQFYDVDFATKEVGFGIGTTRGKLFSVDFGPSVSWGSSPQGLSYFQLQGIGSALFHASIFHAGGGAQLGFTRIGRATAGAFYMLPLGVHLLAGIDVVPLGDFRVFVDARLHADYALFAGPSSVGAEITVGVRF